MAEEVELKLALPQELRRALSRHPLLVAAQEMPARRLVNVYFDTPQQELRARGVALRLRRQAGHWLQTVKCAGLAAGGLSARPEWEQPYGGRFDFDAIDDRRLARWLARRHLEGRLQPVFSTVFRRRTWRIEREHGAALLAMFDEGLVRCGERTSPIRELELELVEGEPAELFAVASELAATLPLKPEPLSKAQRGYLLASGPRAPQRARTTAPLVDAHTGLAEALRRILRCLLAELQGNEAGAAEGTDPEYVHRMRVALRRLRGLFRIFAPLLPAAGAAGLLPRLRELARTLGTARDWDILSEEILAPVLAGFPADRRLADLGRVAAERRSLAHAAVAHALADPGYGRLLIDLGALACDRSLDALASSPDALPEFAGRSLERLRRRTLARAKRADVADAASLHRLRIAIKRWRYAIEFFAPLQPGHAVQARLRRLTRLQRDLGALHDLVNAATPLELCAGEDPALREAVALAGGWHGPLHRRILQRMPKAIDKLVSSESG